MRISEGQGVTLEAVPAARVHDLIITETGTEVLVYDEQTHHIHHLNHTMARVWRWCDGAHSVDDLARLVSSEIGLVIDTDTVRLALGKLADANLLDGSLPDAMRPTTKSRRAFMKKATIAGGIAIPGIVSVTAPTSTRAESGLCGSSICPASAACLDERCFTKYPYCLGAYGGVANGGGVNACLCGIGSLQVCTTTGECPGGEVCLLVPDGDVFTGNCYIGCPA